MSLFRRLIFSQEVLHALRQLGIGLGAGLALQCPSTAGMEYVPERAQSLIATGTGIVVSESVKREIPYRLEAPDEQCLAEWYPDVIDNQVATLKVLNAQCRTGGPY